MSAKDLFNFSMLGYFIIMVVFDGMDPITLPSLGHASVKELGVLIAP